MLGDQGAAHAYRLFRHRRGDRQSLRFDEEKKESNLLPELYESPALPTYSSPRGGAGKIRTSEPVRNGLQPFVFNRLNYHPNN